MPGAAVLPGIVRQLDESGIELAEFSLRKSSLDEVFLTLTGHRAEEAPEAQGTQSRCRRPREGSPMTIATLAAGRPSPQAEPGGGPA